MIAVELAFVVLILAGLLIADALDPGRGSCRREKP